MCTVRYDSCLCDGCTGRSCLRYDTIGTRRDLPFARCNIFVSFPSSLDNKICLVRTGPYFVSVGRFRACFVAIQAGFEALYFGRIDYQDRAKRIAQSDMEMVWRASRSLEERAQIFTGEKVNRDGK